MRDYFIFSCALVVFGMPTVWADSLSPKDEATALTATDGQIPSEASTEAIIEEMGVLAVLEQFMGQTDTIVNRTVTQKAQEHGGLSPQQIVVYTEMGQEMAAVYKDTIAWEIVKPAVIEIFQERFTAEEVNGISAFYQTPAGIALNEKMPAAITETMQLFEKLVVGMTPQIQEIEARARARAEALPADGENKAKVSDSSE